eukprot:26441_1
MDYHLFGLRSIMGSKWTIISLVYVISDIHCQSIECNGNCVCPSSATGNTCILNCNSRDSCKDSNLICRSGDPCKVNCIGDNSCEGNTLIDGSDSTDVTVRCLGENACKGNTVIECGTESCAIACRDSASCEGTQTITNTASNFQCTGACGSIQAPFHIPTSRPTVPPTRIPTLIPTYIPTLDPTFVPTIHPTTQPTNNPSSIPTIVPTLYPTIRPTNVPTHHPMETTYALVESTIVFEWDSQLSQSNERESGDDDDETSNDVRYSNAGMSNESTYHLFIAGTVLIIMSSMLCCFGICVYYSAKKTVVSEEISIAVDKLSSPNPDPDVASVNNFNFGSQALTVPGIDDAKMDELVHVQNTNDAADEEEDEENESESSSSDLTSCSLSTNVGDTLRKMNESDGHSNIKIMDPQMYTWYGYDPMQAGYGMMYGPYGPQPIHARQFPPTCFVPYQNNNVIST